MIATDLAEPRPARPRFSSNTRSPIEGVSDDAWMRFVAALEVQPIRAISASGGFGSYDTRPRRLVELGLATDPEYIRGESGRFAHRCKLNAPLTVERFLADPVIQYAALTKSIAAYYAEIMSGALRVPSDATLAGTLAILHRGGRGALASWPKLFEETRRLYDAVKDAF